MTGKWKLLVYEESGYSLSNSELSLAPINSLSFAIAYLRISRFSIPGKLPASPSLRPNWGNFVIRKSFRMTTKSGVERKTQSFPRCRSTPCSSRPPPPMGLLPLLLPLFWIWGRKQPPTAAPTPPWQTITTDLRGRGGVVNNSSVMRQRMQQGIFCHLFLYPQRLRLESWRRRSNLILCRFYGQKD